MAPLAYEDLAQRTRGNDDKSIHVHDLQAEKAEFRMATRWRSGWATETNVYFVPPLCEAKRQSDRYDPSQRNSPTQGKSSGRNLSDQAVSPSRTFGCSTR